MTDASRAHQPVLAEAVVEGLVTDPEGVYVDATFGRGGHAAMLAARLGVQGRLLGLDQDPDAVPAGEALMAADGRFRFCRRSFAELADCPGLEPGTIAGVLFDLGVSSPQLDDPKRGFSFQSNGPLDMRMNPDAGVSAAQWINGADAEELTWVFRHYGEERHARRIAKAVVAARQLAAIETTGRLAEIVAAAQPRPDPHKHPATRVFQAIRLHLNDELGALEKGLEQALDVLAVGGRLAVISFHSLEDRLVKRFIQQQAKGDDYPKDMPVTADQLKPRVKRLGKAITAQASERAANPRARSAVLRLAEKIA